MRRTLEIIKVIAQRRNCIVLLLAASIFLVAEGLHAQAAAPVPPPPAPPAPGLQSSAAQSPGASAPLPAFEVVSIKPGKPGCVSIGIGSFFPGEFQADCFSLENIIAYAYGFDDQHERILGGPKWIDSANFDIEAKVAASDMDAYSKLKRPGFDIMLQQVLAERFNLKAHHETRVLPVYALVIAKGGPKLKEVKAGDPESVSPITGLPGAGGMFRRGRGKLVAWKSPLTSLPVFLLGELGRTVVDETGLTGNYDFTLTWTPVTMTTETSTEDLAPSIFTALREQLGLELVSKKEPVEVLVIDHIEQPSPN